MKNQVRYVWLLMHRTLGVQGAVLSEKRAKAVLEIRNNSHFEMWKERPYTLMKQLLT